MTHWITRIQPDLRSREARRDLGSAVGMHHRLMSLFPDGAGQEARRTFGVLFRAEDTPGGPQVLLQSNTEPDLSRLPTHYGTGQTKDLSPLLDALEPGRHVRYRIAANAVRRPGHTTRAKNDVNSVVPLMGAAADEWWARQAEASGLTVHSLDSQALDAARGERKEGRHKIRHARTLFEGTAQINDADLLRERTIAGIGRGKAYGCGLLSLAPARGPR
ncbi:type I-E CRISPR-associated protein Cas6/Cse3/CasE [Nocardiopsis quinghaiensis]|uniref:type I-E CRISPR-associated protein Cas6/Cse3/CasE n=1 Tax=Nocardiopsis quinghaiensis TaxID=464995 RepID=UPI00123A93F5|nr:type I-E CRISPR-associated protein Cas6/Cse3/CasE [Nocardiopsis quinghaiensis]